MSIEETAGLGNRNSGILFRLGMILLGVLLGLILLQLFKFGLLLTAMLIGLLLLVMIGIVDGFLAWMLLLVASTLSGYRLDYGAITLRPEHAFFFALIAGWFLAVLAGKMKFHRVPMLLPLVLYVGVNFISTALHAPDKSASYQGAMLLVLYALMYVFTVQVLSEHPNRLKTAIKLLLAIGVLQSLFGIVSLAGHYAGVNLGSVTRPPTATSDAFRAQAGFQEADILGAFTAATALIYMAFITAHEKFELHKRAWVSIASLVVILLALGLSYTRAAWVGFMVGLTILVLIQKPTRNIFNPKALIAILALISIAGVLSLPVVNMLSGGFLTSVSDRAEKIFDFSGGSGAGRVKVQDIALERWEDSRTWGHGTLSLPEKEARPSAAGAWLYSSIIQAIHDTGIVGLLFYAWYQIGVLVVVIQGYLKTRNPFYRAALAGFSVALLALIIASQASSFIWLGFPWLFSGLAVVVAKIAPGVKKTPLVTS